MFIGTGTGFAPLYFQIRALIDRGDTSPAHFVFGVRDETDLFYQEELKNMSKNYSWLSFVQYLSRADYEGGIRGYVTDAITGETVSHYEEFYLCGSPAMVSDARTKLESL